ncbi:ABC transporter ATP-binding protein [Pseudobacteroides cellulosolvens]|uniref:Phosphonate-transporting ATPase n=1 Tax=Pseudobacteroides cellulosolvens ATCC 35603 = DSM 2933 TaxID=398512 RepID=A0A0L6JJR8_9FIRM|nr:ABC transporter ATP-binding protein [Pseudobacteroides cellulosolvens]KNY25632.1 Phosphonate-transporting ATPase [Pseudobacteroides cellulosolvens ATCC 35603 = DSM 2933]
MNNSGEEIISCENLVKIYKTNDIEVLALQGLDLTIMEGELTAIIGNSGSGKSTFLNMLGGLDRPTAGRLVVCGKDLLKLTESQLEKYKLETVGFVWQNNARNLIPYLTALENIELPMILSKRSQRKDHALEILELMGMSHRKNNKLHQLSGGEQQRIAIGIALANNPKLLLADEPTGSVDSRTADKILDIFREINKNLGITIVIVTHDRQLSRKVERVIAIRDGRTSSEFIKMKSYTEEFANLKGEIGGDGKRDEQVELAVVDRAGRLQIPKEYLEAIGVLGKGKVRVELENDKITIYSPEN